METFGHVREQLLASESFVIAELKKVQTLYVLKRIIRYDQDRHPATHTESVAEHVYGMHCLVDYFLPLEDHEGKWDRARIHTLVQYHDSDEIITGDTIGYRKTEVARAAEYDAMETLIRQLPSHLQTTIQTILNEYLKQETMEARFVRAIDKIEPVFHLYNEQGKVTLAELKTTKDQHDRIKIPAIKPFPIIKRFADVMSRQFHDEGFFHTES